MNVAPCSLRPVRPGPWIPEHQAQCLGVSQGKAPNHSEGGRDLLFSPSIREGEHRPLELEAGISEVLPGSFRETGDVDALSCPTTGREHPTACLMCSIGHMKGKHITEPTPLYQPQSLVRSVKGVGVGARGPGAAPKTSDQWWT